MEKLIPDIESYSDLELIKAWSDLESLVLNRAVEQKMDEINANSLNNTPNLYHLATQGHNIFDINKFPGTQAVTFLPFFVRNPTTPSLFAIIL